jgi:nitrite reductase/ring-hydroxylating ferredoxin subunit
MHGWQFDLTTGRCLSTDDESYQLRCHPKQPVAR